MISISDGMTTVATYQYDGQNRRTVKGIYVSGSLDHNEHAYFNEHSQLLEVRKETSGTVNSNPLEQYAWHPFYIDAPVLRDYDSTCSGSSTRYYYSFDDIFNIMAASTNAGAVIERYNYSPDGTPTFLSAAFGVNSGNTSNIGNSVTYTGRAYDAESQLYYFRSRYYGSQLGTFLARDRLGYVEGMSLYDPFFAPNATDPFGLKATAQCCSCLAKTKEASKNVNPSNNLGFGAGGPPCDVSYTCSNGGCGGDGGSGYCSVVGEKKYKVCVRCSFDDDTVDRELAHELQHASDYCAGATSWTACDNCRRYERRAYEKSCGMAFDSMTDPANYENCLKCGASFSCSGVVGENGPGSKCEDPPSDPPKCTFRDIGACYPSKPKRGHPIDKRKCPKKPANPKNPPGPIGG